jgi:RimJ/RimL family protein N-acetyltransferase
MKPCSERLIFRELNVDDVGSLRKIFADPIAMKFYPSTKSEEETLKWIEWNQNSYRECGVGLWALSEKSSGNFIGQCGLIRQQDVAGTDEMEIGYLLVRDYWGVGYATEAAAASWRFGYSTLGLRRAVSLIGPDNQASIRVAERIGMRYEKTIDRWEKSIAVYSKKE